MATQIDLFAPARTSDLAKSLPTSNDTSIDDATGDDASSDEKLGQPIAIPCGVRDRANASCKRLGN